MSTANNTVARNLDLLKVSILGTFGKTWTNKVQFGCACGNNIGAFTNKNFISWQRCQRKEIKCSLFADHHVIVEENCGQATQIMFVSIER